MELVFNLMMGIFIGFYLVLSFLLDKRTITGDVFGARGFPIVLGIIALTILAFITAKTVKNKTKVYLPLFDLKSQAGKTLVLNIIILAAYLYLTNVIGFVLSTLLFLFGSARAMRYKKMPALLIYSVVLTVILVVSFGKVFLVPLPRGIGIFRELSYFIY
ncbi:MAG TPA: hypothetical protein DD734_05510 [Firmicutes bacterium]|jgi:hypothetical protein|nr:hypothetical protein [Bacillota bacterium]HBR34069.1 hypothetical protein [Bacillota bacterium]HBT16249.1 hypothetical protein [Bacillota bacterium]